MSGGKCTYQVLPFTCSASSHTVFSSLTVSLSVYRITLYLTLLTTRTLTAHFLLFTILVLQYITFHHTAAHTVSTCHHTTVHHHHHRLTIYHRHTPSHFTIHHHHHTPPASDQWDHLSYGHVRRGAGGSEDLVCVIMVTDVHQVFHGYLPSASQACYYSPSVACQWISNSSSSRHNVAKYD